MESRRKLTVVRFSAAVLMAAAVISASCESESEDEWTCIVTSGAVGGAPPQARVRAPPAPKPCAKPRRPPAGG